MCFVCVCNCDEHVCAPTLLRIASSVLQKDTHMHACTHAQICECIRNTVTHSPAVSSTEKIILVVGSSRRAMNRQICVRVCVSVCVSVLCVHVVCVCVLCVHVVCVFVCACMSACIHASVRV